MVKLGLIAVLAVSPVLAVPQTAQTAATPGQRLAASWQAPLHTSGRYVVDAAGNRFRLVGGNWHGASGTWDGSGAVGDPAHNHIGEVADEMPLDLDRAPIAGILAGFHELGLTTIRLPFSDQMIHDTTPVPDAAVAANPQLRGDTPLQVYDAVVHALTGDGFAVILNNHTTTSLWCCGLDGNERWNSGQSTAQWEADWLSMIGRYAGDKRVVGADLRNEVRRDVLNDPNWGAGDDHDWQAASAHLADRILTEADPDLLIIVEGINWTGLPVDGFAHGRPDLKPVAQLSHTLVASDKLVYSAHFYGYTGPNHSGATGIGETSDPRYQDMSPAELLTALTQQAFFVTQDPDAHYTHPVWISEFGVGGRSETDPAARAWFSNFVTDLIAMDADFAYWPVTGWQENRQSDTWALLSWDAAGNRMGLDDGDDWRAADWHRLVAATGFTGRVPATRRWNMLSTGTADAVESLRMRTAGDYDSGARKAACPDGQRLLGLSHTGGRGLCSDGEVSWPAGGAPVVVRDETYVDTDWAGGYTKLQCPAGDFATGYAVRGTAVSSLLCVPAGASLGAGGRTVWFDRSDARPAGNPGGDFATGAYQGQCTTGEYVAGVAYTGRITAPGKNPAALLCRTLQ